MRAIHNRPSVESGYKIYKMLRDVHGLYRRAAMSPVGMAHVLLLDHLMVKIGHRVHFVRGEKYFSDRFDETTRRQDQRVLQFFRSEEHANIAFHCERFGTLD